MIRAAIASLLLACIASCTGSGMLDMLSGKQATVSAGTDAVYFGRKLEPEGRAVLHGAGQSDDATFREYSLLMAQSRPMLFMSYVDLKDDLAGYFSSLRSTIDLYPDYIVPQIGLSLNANSAALHYEAAVASGALDDRLATLCTGLKSLDRPVFLRIGYEFNAPWNGYVPAAYIAAFQHIVLTLRACHADAVAAVWDFVPNANSSGYMPFYPGDQWVDWWAINLFPEESLASSTTQRFLDDALHHRFPVMIGESTPRGHPVSEGAKVVAGWYQPFFDLMRRNPQIKAFCYINWDWRNYPQWADWGDARIQDNPVVLAFYKDELRNSLYVNANDRAQTLHLLHAEAALPKPATPPGKLSTSRQR